jgi:hypothetical protein
MANHGLLAGSSFPSRFPIATVSCSPALPTKVYERSKPSGPSTFISQLSFARDSTIDTRHSPRLSLSTCSMTATTSPRTRGSFVFRISILSAMSPILYKADAYLFTCTTGSKAPERRAESPATSDSGLSKNESGNCRSATDSLLK